MAPAPNQTAPARGTPQPTSPPPLRSRTLPSRCGTDTQHRDTLRLSLIRGTTDPRHASSGQSEPRDPRWRSAGSHSPPGSHPHRRPIVAEETHPRTISAVRPRGRIYQPGGGWAGGGFLAINRRPPLGWAIFLRFLLLPPPRAPPIRSVKRGTALARGER